MTDSIQAEVLSGAAANELTEVLEELEDSFVEVSTIEKGHRGFYGFCNVLVFENVEGIIVSFEKPCWEGKRIPIKGENIRIWDVTSTSKGIRANQASFK